MVPSWGFLRIRRRHSIDHRHRLPPPLPHHPHPHRRFIFRIVSNRRERETYNITTSTTWAMYLREMCRFASSSCTSFLFIRLHPHQNWSLSARWTSSSFNKFQQDVYLQHYINISTIDTHRYTFSLCGTIHILHPTASWSSRNTALVACDTDQLTATALHSS